MYRYNNTIYLKLNETKSIKVNFILKSKLKGISSFNINNDP